jgi:hypothetical protein
MIRRSFISCYYIATTFSVTHRAAIAPSVLASTIGYMTHIIIIVSKLRQLSFTR